MKFEKWKNLKMEKFWKTEKLENSLPFRHQLSSLDGVAATAVSELSLTESKSSLEVVKPYYNIWKMFQI